MDVRRFMGWRGYLKCFSCEICNLGLRELFRESALESSMQGEEYTDWKVQSLPGLDRMG